MEDPGCGAVIPILGMHRTGTSALAGALHQLGADLGPQGSWIAPAADNPLGFFEFEPIVDINRAVLAAFGGTWSSPPALPPGWTSDPRALEPRARAAELAGQLPVDMVVKDPRLSLVLPLWDAVAAPQPAVFCLRHPTSVARSLEKRNDFVIDEGLMLWFRYSAAARLHRPDALVVEYEQLLTHPETELRRVADHIGLDTTETTVDLAARSIRAGMAHNESSELPDSPIGEICGSLYALLRAGHDLDHDHHVWSWARLVTELPWAGPSDRELAIARSGARDLEIEISRLTDANAQLTERCGRLESDLRRASTAIDRLAFAESVALASQPKDHPT